MSKIVKHELDLTNPPPLTQAQKAELAALAEKPDSEIDFSDIPRLTPEFFAKAIRNPFLRTPVEATVHLDNGVLAWLRSRGDDSPASVDAQINAVLWQAIQSERREKQEQEDRKQAG